MAAMLMSGGTGKEGPTWENGGVDLSGAKPDTSGVEVTVSPSKAATSPTGYGTPVAGAFSTCHACTVPRVSRSVACQGCRKLFHWTCMGFYEHKYQKPGPNWRCKECKAPESSSSLSAGAGSSPTAPAAETTQMPDPEDTIDVGEEPLVSTAPPAPTPLIAAGQNGTAAGATAVSAPAPAPPTTSPIGPGAGAVTLPSASGERICPVCRNGLGRKRTIDCSVCLTPSHAACVNVRGAVMPKSWVCRDCKLITQAPAEESPADVVAAAPANPPVAAETVSRESLFVNVSMSGYLYSSSDR